MDIVTWEPKDNDEMTKRYSKWKWPEGVTVVSSIYRLYTTKLADFINKTKKVDKSKLRWRTPQQASRVLN